VSTPVRRIDVVAGGVAASFGAGLFLGLTPAASLAGRWLLVAVLGAAVAGSAAVLSTSDRPLETMPVRLRRMGFVLGTVGRLAAAVAIAGTVATYLTPLAGVAVVVAATAAAVVGLPPVVTRVAAVVVLSVLLVVVVACFAIAPAAPPVAADDGGSPLGVLAAAGLLSVCFFGVERGGGGRRAVMVVLGVVTIGCLAVAWAALHQVGAPRLAISPAPLRAVLDAADATAVAPLLLGGVVVGCGFALLGVLGGLRVSGVPPQRLAVVGGAATAFGALLVPPAAALAAAAVLLLGDAAFRAIAVRHPPVDR
jgi:APA family basic amino acid/polyamine antiporter